MALTVNFATKLQSYQQQLQVSADDAVRSSLGMDMNSLTTPKEEPATQTLSVADNQKEIFDVYNLRNDSQ
jgi:hypothetical protein